MQAIARPSATPAAVPTPAPSWNPWPHALMAFFAVFGSCVAAVAVLAARQRVDLVRPDYYDQEIRYQQQIDRLERTAVPGADVALAWLPQSRELKLALPARHAVDFAGGRIALYRPSDARRDVAFELSPTFDGLQSVSLATLDPGLWKVQVSWKSGGKEYFHEESLTLPARR